jgi:hypothetical protein
LKFPFFLFGAVATAGLLLVVLTFVLLLLLVLLFVVCVGVEEVGVGVVAGVFFSFLVVELVVGVVAVFGVYDALGVEGVGVGVVEVEVVVVGVELLVVGFGFEDFCGVVLAVVFAEGVGACC